MHLLVQVLVCLKASHEKDTSLHVEGHMIILSLNMWPNYGSNVFRADCSLRGRGSL